MEGQRKRGGRPAARGTGSRGSAEVLAMCWLRQLNRLAAAALTGSPPPPPAGQAGEEGAAGSAQAPGPPARRRPPALWHPAARPPQQPQPPASTPPRPRPRLGQLHGLLLRQLEVGVGARGHGPAGRGRAAQGGQGRSAARGEGGRVRPAQPPLLLGLTAAAQSDSRCHCSCYCCFRTGRTSRRRCRRPGWPAPRRRRPARRGGRAACSPAGTR